MKNTNLIGISGKIGSGKDTIGKIIQYLTHCKDEGDIPYNEFINLTINANSFCDWKIKKYAFKLKQIASIMLGIPIEDFEKQEVKDRVLGEEWRRWCLKEKHSNIRTPKSFYGIFNSEKEIWEFIEENRIQHLEPYSELPTIRQFLQELGTEAMRNVIHPNALVNALFADYKPIQSIISKSNTFNDNRLNHGYNKTRIFRIYHNIKQRCNNPKHPRYESYGGKGISLCKEWSEDIISFIKWSESNGYSETLTLDRKDNSKGYSPDNCRWVSYSSQNINTDLRKDNTTDFKGVTLEKGKYRASIQINGRRQFLGYFTTAELASEAYEEAYMERERLYEVLEKEENVVYPCWCITDVRFPNEKQAIEERRGIVIRVNREVLPKVVDLGEEVPGIDTKGAIVTFPSIHPSETALDDATFNYVIDNNGTIEELIEKVKKILIKEQII